MIKDTNDLYYGEVRLKLKHFSEEDKAKGYVPAYHFAITDSCGREVGECDLRIGHNEKLYYGGNIGYRVFEEYRGHHYAGKAVKVLLKLAAKHEMGYVIITCNPDNIASKKTCEYAGGELIELAELPEDNDMRIEKGETEKYIFRFEVG